MMVHQLTLYITGHTAKSEMAIANLRRIFEDWLGGQGEIAIVDVLEQPEIAEREKILATPTLVKQSPPPMRRVIGDLSDLHQVAQGLGLQLGLPTPRTKDEFQANQSTGVK